MRTEALRRPAWLLGGAMYGGAALVATLFVATDWARVEAPDWLADRQFAAAPPPRALPRPPADFSVIWGRMEPPAPVTRAVPVPLIAPAAQSAYTVVATFCESQPEFSFAVLRDAATKQRLVKIGDSVDEMKVVSISKEGIVVLQGGLQVFLKMVEASTGLAAAQTPAAGGSSGRLGVGGPSRPGLPVAMERRALPAGPAGAQLPAAGQGPATPGTGPATGEAGAEEEDQFTLTREELQTYVNNLPTLLSQMELTPHSDAQGKPDGLYIGRLGAQSVAAQRGLRQGDIVKLIYDEPITNVSEIAPLARKILADDPAFIEIIVERDGDEESLIYEVR